MLDSLSSLILIGSALASRQSHLESSYPVSIMFFVISCAFALLCIVLIAYQTWVGRTEYDKRMEKFSTLDADYNISATLNEGFIEPSDAEDNEIDENGNGTNFTALAPSSLSDGSL